jgi:hypothetical protein
MRSLRPLLDATYGDILRFRDAEGRPLREEASPLDVRAGVVMETRACTYPGSRRANPLPMNVSALKQLKAHWPAVTIALAHMRERYVRPDEAIDLVWLWRFSTFVESVPLFAFFRADGRVLDGALPVPLAGAFKVVLGVTAALWELGAARVFLTPSDDLLLDEERFYNFIEESGALVGKHQACAGPEAMIREMLSVLLNAVPTSDELTDNVVKNWPALHDFSRTRTNYRLLNAIFQIRAWVLLRDTQPRDPRVAVGLEGESIPSEVELLAALDVQGRTAVTDRILGFVTPPTGSELAKPLERLRVEGFPHSTGSLEAAYSALLDSYADIAGCLRADTQRSLGMPAASAPFEPVDDIVTRVLTSASAKHSP